MAAAPRVAVMRWAITCLLAGLLLAPGARAEGSRSSKVMPYAEARETFRRLGYQPFMMPGADVCDPNDPRCYPELEYCAKSRTWACTYSWRRGKAIIEVETRYDIPVVARSECVLNCTRASPSRPVKRSADAPEKRDASVD